MTPRINSVLTALVLGVALLSGALRCLAADGNATVAASAPSSNATSPNPPAKGLHYADVPAQGRQIVAEALAKYAFTLPAGVNVRIEPPLARYNTRDLADNPFPSGNLDADTTLYQYYYPVTQDGKLVKAFYFMVNAATRDLDFNSIDPAPTPRIYDAVQKLAGLPEVQAGSFEARLLYHSRGNSTGSPVLWLKSTVGGADLIYVTDGRLTASLRPTEAGTLYTAADFVAKVRAATEPTRFTPLRELRSVADDERRNEYIDRRNAIILENQRKTASGEDTNTTRLLALQAALGQTLALLQQAPPEAKVYYAQPVADLIRAQASVARGLDYVTAHPEADRLVVQAPSSLILGHSWKAQNLNLTQGANGTRGDSFIYALYQAARILGRGFWDFMGLPTLGISGIGEIGTHRDSIFRDVGLAEIDLVRSNQAFLNLERTGSSSVPPADSSPLASTNIPAHPGSISGTVGYRLGYPAGRGVVFCMAVASPNAKIPAGTVNGVLPGVIPCTISDENGNFVIKNLPPGYYLVTGEKNWIVVEVREGKETHLPDLLEVRPAPVIRGAAWSFAPPSSLSGNRHDPRAV